MEEIDLFGRAFEHFLLNEARAYMAYSRRYRPLAFRKTSLGHVVDLTVGDLELAWSSKQSGASRIRALKGIRVLRDGQHGCRTVVVAGESSLTAASSRGARASTGGHPVSRNNADTRTTPRLNACLQ